MEQDQARQFMKAMGANLRAARDAAGMSLQDAGDFLAVSKAAVGHWETGTNPISIDKLFRLARKYGTTVAALVGGQLSNNDLAALVVSRLDAATAPAAPASPPLGDLTTLRDGIRARRDEPTEARLVGNPRSSRTPRNPSGRGAKK